MNVIQQILEDYGRLEPALTNHLNGWKSAELRAAQLGLETRTLDADQLREQLTTLREASGWLLYPSELRVLSPAQPAPAAQAVSADQLPLQGELKQGEHHQRLTYLGAGRWQLSSANITWVEDAEAQVLLERVVQLGTEHAPGALKYWRVWGLSNDQQLVPQTALFDGFEGDKP